MKLKSDLALGGGLLMALIATPALSSDSAFVTVVRSNMQTIAVDAQSLVRVAVSGDTVTRLDFPKRETIETVVVSDTENLLINPAGNALFVKSKKAAGTDNMHVITRTAAGQTFAYQFELRTHKPDIVKRDDGYVVRLVHSQKKGSSS